MHPSFLLCNDTPFVLKLRSTLQGTFGNPVLLTPLDEEIIVPPMASSELFDELPQVEFQASVVFDPDFRLKTPQEAPNARRKKTGETQKRIIIREDSEDEFGSVESDSDEPVIPVDKKSETPSSKLLGKMPMGESLLPQPNPVLDSYNTLFSTHRPAWSQLFSVEQSGDSIITFRGQANLPVDPEIGLYPSFFPLLIVVGPELAKHRTRKNIKPQITQETEKRNALFLNTMFLGKTKKLTFSVPNNNNNKPGTKRTTQDLNIMVRIPTIEMGLLVEDPKTVSYPPSPLLTYPEYPQRAPLYHHQRYCPELLCFIKRTVYLLCATGYGN